MSNPQNRYDQFVQKAVYAYPEGSKGSLPSLQGLTYAVLALAEAVRPQPTQVDVQVNTDAVKAAVREGLENRNV